MLFRDERWPDGTPCWVDLMVPDRTAAAKFYESLLGWDVQFGGAETGYYGMAQLAGRPVAGVGEIPAEQAGMPAAWTTYLAVSDVDKAVAAIAEAGGHVVAPPMDVMTQGRMAIATDSTGSVFGLWQAGQHSGTQVTLAPGALAWNENMSRDFAAAKTFYGNVFGYSFNDISNDEFTYATLDIDGRPTGGLGQANGDYEPGWMTYFWSVDVDAAAAKIPELGGTVTENPVDTPFGRMLMAKDNQGASFQLMAPNEQSGTQEGWGA
ncbi:MULTISPECIES: VOC family protein [unclassified Amycolatopsis]|uniref:VOC family protein n=1 Tax=unclassified Amycolatopsis TaxID=2618356 RepID=UPI001C6A854B|nr:VOC family protein [Amycolatopsis sp. DSM 110486]QYN25080.1 VOC family protein [Amycolatopsis sp. DSM 110486]